MSGQIFPTKGNLIASKKSLDLAKLGYDLLDRKRNILIREMMSLIDSAKEIQSRIDDTFNDAYNALQNANVTLGRCDNISYLIPVENGLSMTFKSVMGVTIPTISLNSVPLSIIYGLDDTNEKLDETYINFDNVKKLTVSLAQSESSIYRLADAIKKTQKRANALKNIIIPKYTEIVKFIVTSLEEKDREEFSRLKIIKNQKN